MSFLNPLQLFPSIIEGALVDGPAQSREMFVWRSYFTHLLPFGKRKQVFLDAVESKMIQEI